MKKLIDFLNFGTKDYAQEMKNFLHSGKTSTGGGNKPELFIWRTGSVAVGAAGFCRKNGIKVTGFFVNVEKFNLDPRIQRMNFDIISLTDLIENHSNVGVVVGHSRYELADELKKYPQIKNYGFCPVLRETTFLFPKVLSRKILKVFNILTIILKMNCQKKI